MVGLALESDLDGVEGIFDVFARNTGNLQPSPSASPSHLNITETLGATYRSIDDVFDSFHSRSSAFALECQLRLGSNRGGHIEGGLGHSGDGSGVGEGKSKTANAFSFLSSQRTSFKVPSFAPSPLGAGVESRF